MPPRVRTGAVIWRELKPGEADLERLFGLFLYPVLFLASILGTGRGTGLWYTSCRFFRRAGIPCPTCGSSRAFRHMLGGRFIDAFQIQPLMTGLALFYTLFALYAWMVVLARLPRLRFSVPGRGRTWLLGALLAVTAHWAYLIFRHRGHLP